MKSLSLITGLVFAFLVVLPAWTWWVGGVCGVMAVIHLADWAIEKRMGLVKR